MLDLKQATVNYPFLFGNQKENTMLDLNLYTILKLS